MTWFETLSRASLRGVPFAVLGTDARVGRRNSVHEYPYRDTVWVEDLGRGARRIGITGFLISNSRVYGGGDVRAQRDRMIAAVEAAGEPELVHPTLGRMTVSVMSMSFAERWDHGGYIELQLDLVEAGIRTFPSVVVSTPDQVEAAATKLDTATGTAFVRRMRAPLSLGGSISGMVEQVTRDYAGQIRAIAGDATNLFGLSSLLPGNFGRYWGGGSIAALSGHRVGLLGGLNTFRQLVEVATGARSDIGLAATVLEGAAAGLGLSTSADFVLTAQALLGSLLAAVSNPRDGVRVTHRAWDFHPARSTTSSAIGLARRTAQSATGDAFRRSALAALARASAAWQPASYDEAVFVRRLIADAYDSEIVTAGDQAEDDAYTALSDARAAVVTDISTRAADLARMVPVRTTLPMPSLALAYRLYQDPARAEELAAEAGSPHPAFLRTEFQALSS